MYNLAHLTLSDMSQATTRLRKLGQGASSMEHAAGRVARFLFEELGDPVTQKRGSALVRIYKTHPFADLPPDLKSAAIAVHPDLAPTTRCLVLLATVGTEEPWNDRRRSSNHRVIPLPSAEVLDRLPMVAALLAQLGVDLGLVLAPTEELVLDGHETNFNVFHVPVAKGSPHIPAQAEFVDRYGIASVVGCGGQLPSGHIFAAILFSTLPIGRETADLFKPLTLAIKLTLLPFVSGTVFEPATPA